MDLSMRWLSDYIDCDMPIKDFCSAMTLSGSKVEKYTTEGEEISNVVVGKLLEVKPHPDSDHLLICQVEVGQDEPVQIVTGAQNVHEGAFVPAALHNSTLPNGVKIKKGKLRGVPSNGMLCSLGELGLSLNDFPYAQEDGIFLLGEDCDRIPGLDIRKAIGLDDTCVEFEITSNRPDCMSVLGLAREAHATFNKPISPKAPEFVGTDDDTNNYVKAEILNNTLCSRYMCGVVKNVKIEPSPRWMRERLRASGVRPINNFVDITNYVMLEYGQPMHAFDLRYVEDGQISVRNAAAGEKITTLDGEERELAPEMLVIADSKKPIAVAGVMGGEYSGIMADTTTVVFESAMFDGASVRTTAKKLGMRTESSSRYEKGLDPTSCELCLKRAFQLVELLGAGEVCGTYIDCYPRKAEIRTAPFNAEWNNKFLGTDIPEQQQIEYLNRLEIKVENGVAYSPYYRIDLEVKADIAEEIARLYDYNNIDNTIIRGVAQARLTPKQKFERTISDVCIGLGLDEITTFSFVSPKNFDKINLPENSKLRNTVKITNPLGEDTSVMRTTIIPSMCEVLARNYSFRNMQAGLFELGNEYIPIEGEVLPIEPERLCIGMYDAQGGVDFFNLKGAVERLLDRLGVEDYEITRADEDCGFEEYHSFHPGRVAVIIKDGTALGILGELHPNVLENYGIGTRAYCAKLNVDSLMENAVTQKTYKPLPKFPASTRDLSLVIDEQVPVAHLEKAIRKGIGDILESVTLFDIYQGKQIEAGKKSVSYAIVMRKSDSTLTDEQADKAMNKALKELEEIGAKIRS